LVPSPKHWPGKPERCQFGKQKIPNTDHKKTMAEQCFQKKDV